MSRILGSVLVSGSFPLSIRNFIPSGLASHLEQAYGARVQVVSPYDVASFRDGTAQEFPNLLVPGDHGDAGFPTLRCVTAFDRLLRSIRLTGFSIEYPEGSLLTMDLSSRRNPQWLIAQVLTRLAPRTSRRRAWLRQLDSGWRPRRRAIVEAFDQVRPEVVLVASPGHYWLDHLVLDEAHRRGIPSACVVLSWDNLYSRGPLIRRPELLMVWSEEMRRQAIELHQFPTEQIAVVGALQFMPYAQPPMPAELAAMRAKLGLTVGEPYLAYVCGARTATYDVEEVLVLLEQLRSGPFAHLKVVVRPHPQGKRKAYERLLTQGVILDASPDLLDQKVRPDAFDHAAIRHMAAFLSGAEFVVSSWGTTALLEACLFDRPCLQLRWMDAISHQDPTEVKKVRDFQRYLHMKAFDATGARPYCDRPDELNPLLEKLTNRDAEFRGLRRKTVEHLVALPLGGVIERVGENLRRLAAAKLR